MHTGELWAGICIILNYIGTNSNRKFENRSSMTPSHRCTYLRKTLRNPLWISMNSSFEMLTYPKIVRDFDDSARRKIGRWNVWHLKIDANNFIRIGTTAMSFFSRNETFFSPCLIRTEQCDSIWFSRILNFLVQKSEAIFIKCCSFHWSSQSSLLTFFNCTLISEIEWELLLFAWISKLIIWPGKYPPTGAVTVIRIGCDKQQQRIPPKKNVWFFSITTGN